MPPFLDKPGIVNLTALTYLNWSGRWAGVGIEVAMLSTMPLPSAYPWLVFALIVVQCLLLYAAIWLFVGNIRLALFFSAVIACVYWATMSSPEQGLFWIPGAVESQLPLTLVSLMFALVLSRRIVNTKRSGRLTAIAAAVLAFVIPAFHELAGTVLVFSLSVITASAWLSKSDDRKTWLIVFTTSALGFLVVFFAPGNSARISAVPNRGNYLETVKGSWEVVHHYVVPWFLDFRHWLLASLIWLDPGVASLRKKFSGLSSFGKISGFLLIWISLILIAIGAAIWNLAKEPPARTMNLIYGMFLIGWLGLAFVLTRPHPRFSLHPALRTMALSIILILLSALIATSHNTVMSIADVARGRAQSWDAELNRRVVMLKAADRNTDVIVPPIQSRPESLAGNDITSDPNHWSNRCLAKYYGAKSVSIPAAAKMN